MYDFATHLNANKKADEGLTVSVAGLSHAFPLAGYGLATFINFLYFHGTHQATSLIQQQPRTQVTVA